jgi:hypothetical protein
LLFKLLKFLAVVFGVVSLLALATLIMLLSQQPAHQDSINNQFTSGILRTTIYSLSPNSFGAYTALDFLITVILSVALIYWGEKEKTYTIECLNETTLASYSTVVLKNLHLNYNEHHRNLFLSYKFGEIAEIYTVRNFGDDLLHYKGMWELVQSYKKEKALLSLDENRNCNELLALFFEFREGHKKLKQQVKNSEHYKPCFAFIKFKKIEDREKLLEYEEQKNSICCRFGQRAASARDERKTEAPSSHIQSNK